MTPTNFLVYSAFLVGLSGLTFNRAHFLSALLCLEGMMLTLFIALSLWTLQLNATGGVITPVVMLGFSAAEASAGLSLLVATARTHGTDHMKNFNLLQC
nr:NADH dehydrogenase subunit 4L [Melanonus zugmayeri]